MPDPAGPEEATVMGKGKSSLELTLDRGEKDLERLEDLAEHDEKKVRRIVERAVKTYLALRRGIPDRIWEEILGVADEKDVDPGAILAAYAKDGWKRRRRDL